jgi:hypothetical protein
MSGRSTRDGGTGSLSLIEQGYPGNIYLTNVIKSILTGSKQSARSREFICPR